MNRITIEKISNGYLVEVAMTNPFTWIKFVAVTKDKAIDEVNKFLNKMEKEEK